MSIRKFVIALIIVGGEYVFRCDGRSASDAQRLLEHMLTGYNKLIRPVNNHTDVVTVRLKLKVGGHISIVDT